MQIYLLTVLTTILAGLALAGEFLTKRFERYSEYTDFMANPVYRILLGAMTILIGIINLFPNYEGNVLILGDLLPSLIGIAGGILLIAEFLSKQKETEVKKAAELAEKVEKFSSPYLTIVGISSVLIGILHAILPKVIII
ncbi:MAG: hypothetical protein CSA76_02330 [Spirochaetales bacterium]|nr:MAG: hypothetical protein CSA76_02330 [Spirochaetales bacterium]